jgi:hypothetical protein
MELNKDKQENLTAAKFKEWKAANEQQEKANVEKPNHVEQTIAKQETVAPVQQPVISNSQTLNASQPVV